MTRRRKCNARSMETMHRISKSDRSLTVDMNLSTVHRLFQFNLMSKSSSLIAENNRRRRPQFPNPTLKTQEWSKVLFTDEKEINRLSSDSKWYANYKRVKNIIKIIIFYVFDQFRTLHSFIFVSLCTLR